MITSKTRASKTDKRNQRIREQCNNLTEEQISRIMYYTDNDMKKLKELVNKILNKKLIFLKELSNDDNDEFYSIANEQLLYAVIEYDSDKCDKFEPFLYTYILRKLTTLTRDLTRSSRCNKKYETDEHGNIVLGDDGKPIVIIEEMIRLDRPVDNGSGKMVNLYETIPDNRVYIDETLSKEMYDYLNSLSKREKELLNLLEKGHPRPYICNKMKISVQTFNRLKDGLTDSNKIDRLMNRMRKDGLVS